MLALLKACPDELIRLYSVDPAVGNVRNDVPTLLDPTGSDLNIGDLVSS